MGRQEINRRLVGVETWILETLDKKLNPANQGPIYYLTWWTWCLAPNAVFRYPKQSRHSLQRLLRVSENCILSWWICLQASIGSFKALVESLVGVGRVGLGLA